MARSVATILLCGSLWTVGCGEAEPFARFSVEFASPELRERAELVRAQVREGGCEGPPVFSTEIARGGDSRAQPGRLASGVYGLWAAARDSSCNWYAKGCRLFKVPVSGAELIVVLEAVEAEHDASCGGGAPADGGSVMTDGGATNGGDPPSSSGGGSGDDAGTEDAASPDPIPSDAGSTGTGMDAGASGADASSTGGDGSPGSGADAGGGGAPSDAGSPADAGSPTDAGAPVFDPRAPKCLAPAANVVACYDFEGSLLDATAHHNDALGTARYETGLSGRALRVNGNTIRALDDPSLNVAVFTIELWVRIDNLLNLTREPGAPSAFVDKDQQYTVGFSSDGSLVLQIFRAAGDLETTIGDSPVDTGAFRYLAFVFDGSRNVIYLDGRQVASEPVSVRLFSGNGGTMHIGSGSPSATSPFDGLIDALRIWGVALSASEICHNAGGELSAGVCR